MVVSVNSIPSMNVPFTDKNGRITPIWHEFLRAFVSATSDGTINENMNTTSVTAGAGLTGGGAGNITLNVGAGSGLAVNADDVSVDIVNQTSVQAALDDNVLISDFSDNNTIKKTKVRNIIELAGIGGGNTHVQYNENGSFAGNSAFTTDGIGGITLSNITLSGDIALANNSVLYWPTGGSSSYCIKGAGGTPIIQGANSNYRLTAVTSGFQFDVSAGNQVTFSDGSGVSLLGSAMSLQRNAVSGVTASTTQTQGQGVLTRDINQISTVANANDTVTLRFAVAGRYQLIFNDGANTLQIFPASGDNLCAGLNTSTTLAAGSIALFIAYDTTNYKRVI